MPRQDQDYVTGLCDEVLGEPASREHRFDWLRGDPGKNGRGRTLPVDAYYEKAGLVVEYYESQHWKPIAHFDKPDRLTVSGVHRGEQRRRYDQLRVDLVGARSDIDLVIIRADQLDCDSRGRLRHNRDHDLPVVAGLLQRAG